MKTVITLLLLLAGLTIVSCAVTDVINSYLFLPGFIILMFGIARLPYFHLDTIEFPEEPLFARYSNGGMVVACKVNGKPKWLSTLIFRDILGEDSHPSDYERWPELKGTTVKFKLTKRHVSDTTTLWPSSQTWGTST